MKKYLSASWSFFKMYWMFSKVFIKKMIDPKQSPKYALREYRNNLIMGFKICYKYSLKHTQEV